MLMVCSAVRRAMRSAGRTRPALVLMACVGIAWSVDSQTRAIRISYAEASPVLDALHDNLPAELRGKTSAEIEAAWPGWITSFDAATRARLARGDEDSVVNLWLFGTTFTTLPPARDRDLAKVRGQFTVDTLAARRLDDFIRALAAPGSNERVQFARQVVERRGFNPATGEGRAATRQYLSDLRARAIAEVHAYEREVASAHGNPAADFAVQSTIFRERGLSSDTSLLTAFGVDQALVSLAAQGRLARGSVRRAAIVGPGLDFANKTDGYDFYPEQTVQPFALVDSLNRIGLAAPGLAIMTFDLSPRVNQHLEAAIERARRGSGYVLQLPLAAAGGWHQPLVEYWQRIGETIGSPVPSAAPPAQTVLRVRAVRLRPDVVRMLTPIELNVVVEHVAIPAEQRFDLVIATNVLVYYDIFEQSLALANIAAMLRPGGLLISNDAVFPAPPMDPHAGYTTVTYNDRQFDHMLWYQRQ